jgi:hypothetical protein
MCIRNVLQKITPKFHKKPQKTLFPKNIKFAIIFDVVFFKVNQKIVILMLFLIFSSKVQQRYQKE